jgi:hypothetical protein
MEPHKNASVDVVLEINSKNEYIFFLKRSIVSLQILLDSDILENLYTQISFHDLKKLGSRKQRFL